MLPRIPVDQGIAGRAAKLEDKLLFHPNANIAAILKALSFVGRFEQAMDLLDKLEKEGVQLKVSHYNSAIKACGEIGNWSSALIIFQRMQETGVSRNASTYHLLQDILWEYCDDESIKLSIMNEAKLDGINVKSLL